MGAVVPLRRQFSDDAGRVTVKCPGKSRVRAEDCICGAAATHWHACGYVFQVVASLGGGYCPFCRKQCRWPRDAVSA